MLGTHFQFLGQFRLNKRISLHPQCYLISFFNSFSAARLSVGLILARKLRKNSLDCSCCSVQFRENVTTSLNKMATANTLHKSLKFFSNQTNKLKFTCTGVSNRSELQNIINISERAETFQTRLTFLARKSLSKGWERKGHCHRLPFYVLICCILSKIQDMS